MGSKGIVASSAALGILLQDGIGDTIRVSLTPEPGGDRSVEVKVAQEILQTMGFRTFVPLVAACPGCGRTTSTTFQELARDIQSYIVTSMPEWKTRFPGVENLNVAVMGCIVNGPGESKHADIGISLPGTGETPRRSRLHRRPEGPDAARRQHRGRVQASSSTTTSSIATGPASATPPSDTRPDRCRAGDGASGVWRRKRSPVGRPDFKSGKGCEPVLGGFDPHSLPPILPPWLPLRGIGRYLPSWADAGLTGAASRHAGGRGPAPPGLRALHPGRWRVDPAAP